VETWGRNASIKVQAINKLAYYTSLYDIKSYWFILTHVITDNSDVTS